MKHITIFNIEKARICDDPAQRRRYVEAVGDEMMDASDGYHTFSELYDHRITLFIALCRTIQDRVKTYGSGDNDEVWRSKLHSDGSGYEGWFILGIGKKEGEQITYHLPIRCWEDTEFAETLEKSPEWDRHTHKDVLKRLKNI